MKKLLGVSIAALLAVSPMMANATQTATAITGDKLTAPTQANTQIATTSYVKGAYADIAAEHNKVVADITVPAAAEGTYKAIDNGNSVAENLVGLDAQVKILTGANTVENSVAYQVKENSQDADYDARSDYANGTIGKAIKTLETTVSAAGTASTVNPGAYIGRASNSSTNVSGALTALDTATEANSDAITAILDSNITVYGSWNGGGTPSGDQTVSIASLQGNSYAAPAADATTGSGDNPSNP